MKMFHILTPEEEVHCFAQMLINHQMTKKIIFKSDANGCVYCKINNIAIFSKCLEIKENPFVDVCADIISGRFMFNIICIHDVTVVEEEKGSNFEDINQTGRISFQLFVGANQAFQKLSKKFN